MASRGEKDMEEQIRELTEELGGVSVGDVDAAALLDKLQEHQKEKEMRAQVEEQKKYLAYLEERLKERLEVAKEQAETGAKLQMQLKEARAEVAAARAETEMERKRVHQLREEEWRMTAEYDMLVAENEEVLRQLDSHAVFHDYLVQVVKLSGGQFKSVPELVRHLQGLLHQRELLRQEEKEIDQQLKERREALSTLKSQHHLKGLQMRLELSELQTKLDRLHEEDVTLDRKFSRILQSAAKERHQLAKFHMAVLNLYEKMGGMEDKEEPVNVDNVEEVLEKIKLIFRVNRDFLNEHQAALHQRKDGKGRKQGKRKKRGGRF